MKKSLSGQSYFISFMFNKVIFAGISFTLFAALSLNAQEICDNGIDDDGDNLVDVFDPDCPCDDQTLLCQPSCEFVSPGGALNFTSQWSSNDTVLAYQSPLVGDIDNDGVPEVLIMSTNSLQTGDPRRAKNIHIINGQTGLTELTLITPFMSWVGPTPFALADIDGDGFGEIIVAAMDHPDNLPSERRRLFCYEHTGALKWVSDSTFGNALTARFGSSIGIADFNSDGQAEVYLYNKIFNAQTGALLVSGSPTGGRGIMSNESFGDVSNVVAADITSDPGLELAAGNTVYNINITNTAGIAGNTISPITIAGRNDGFTSLADIDLDGNLDIVVSSQGSTGQLYAWNPNNGSPQLIASINFPNTGGNWIGVPFIGDMDKDCQPEIGVTRSRRVYALDYNGSTTFAIKWTLVTSDASGFTGITMFDFNQDGTQELVYRDESNLRIIDGSGSTPITIGTNPCASGTGAEMAIVADVDGDGQAEICVSCAVSGVNLARLQIFESSGQPWAPCRDVWNQYGYYNVNINNNLSIPIQQQQHQVLLSTITCPFYTCSENRPFNTYLSQSTFLTQEGCPIYPASDVALSLPSSSCNGSAAYNLSLTVTNVGGAPSDSGYPIRFYAGNPFTGTAIPIPVVSGPNATGGAIEAGDFETLNFTLDISDPEKPFSLFVLLNDNGNTASPFNFPLSLLPECNYGDNVISIANIDCCPFGDLAITNVDPASAEFCEGENALFTVTASSSVGLTAAIYTWTFPDNSEIVNDSVLVSESGTYLVTVKDDAQCSVSETVNVIAILLPTEAAAGENQQVCEDFTSLEGNLPIIGAGVWSLLSGSAVIQNPTSATTAISDIALGISEFVWTITNGSDCVSSDTVSIERIPAPDNSLAGDDQQVCVDIAQLNANSPSSGSGTWILVSGSGIIADANLSSTSVSDLGEGLNVFRWSISNGICTPSVDDITIERFIQPTTALAGDDQQLCASSTSLDATLPSTGTGNWTFLTGTGTLSNSADPQTDVSDLGLGITQIIWTVANGNCSLVTDTISIQVDENPSQASVGIDLQICSDAASLSATEPLVGTGNWTVSPLGASITNPTNANTAVNSIPFGNSAFTWIVSNGVCPPTTAIQNVQRDEPPSTAIAGVDSALCGNSLSLNAEIPSNGTGVWSISSGSATIADSSNNQTLISELAFAQNILEWTVSNGVCPPSVDQVEITAFENPSPVDAGEDQSICEDNTTLNAVLPNTGSGTWSIISGTATISNANNNASTLTGIAIGTVVLRWTVTNGPCEEFDEISITRSENPSPASAGIDQTLCGTSTLLEAETPVTGIGTWQILSGTATLSNVNDPNDQVSGLSIGINELVWVISNGACPTESDTLTITVNEDPVEPQAGADQSICETFTTLNASSPAIGTGTWSIVSGTGTIADPADPISEVTGIDVGITVLRWTIVNGSCEVFDQVSITRSENPSPALAGENQEICEGSDIQLNANTPSIGTGLWSISSGIASITDPSDSQTEVSSLSTGTVTFIWTISNGACLPSADSITVTISENNAFADAGGDVEICADTVTINAANPISGSGAWQVISGSGDLSNPDSQSSLISNLNPGTTTLLWTVTNGACPELSDELVITVNDLPSQADAGADQQLCSDLTSLAAETPTTGSGIWTVVSGNGIFEDAQNPQTNVSGLDEGVNVLQWTISSGTCPPNSDQVVITRDSVAAFANAGADLEICGSETTELQAFEPNPGSGTWTIISGDATLSDATNPNSEITPNGFGLVTLVWTVITGNCPETSDTLIVTNFEPPSAANAGVDSALCSTNYFLNAEIPVVGIGAWSTTGSGIFANPSASTTEVSMLSMGENVIIWTVTNGSCPANSDSLVLNVAKKPITPNAGPDLSVCDDNAVLSAGEPVAGSGTWTLISGSAVIADVNSPNSAVSGLVPGIAILRWTVSSGDCEVFDEMQILRSEPPSIANAGNDIAVCSETATLNAELPLVGTGTWSLLSGTASFENSGDPSTEVSGLASGENVFQWTITSGSCKPSTDNVTVTRDTTVLPADAGDPIVTCSDTAILGATPSSNGFWTVLDGIAVIADLNNPLSEVSGLVVGTVTLLWTVPENGNCPETIDEITITRLEAPSAAIAGEDMMICDDEITLSANVPTVGTGMWEVISGNAILLDPSNATTTATDLELGNNVFEWRITNGVCPPESDEITIARGDTAFAGNDITLCDSSATLSAVLPAGLSGFWTVASGSGVFSDSTSATSIVDSLGEGENIFVWTILGGFCPDSTDEVIVNRSCNTPPSITNDEFTVDEDSTLSGSFITDDVDPDGTTLTADTVLIQQPSNGTVIVNSDGTFIYTPDPNYFGLDTFIVAVCDSGLPLPIICGNDTIIINVLPINDPPAIVNDTLSGNPGATISGNINDNNSDIDNDELVANTTPISGPSSGTIVLQPDGSFIYTPNEGFIGSDTIVVLICEGPDIPPEECYPDTIFINIGEEELMANAGPDQIICGNITALSAEDPAPNTGTWSIASGSGTFANQNDPETTVSALAEGDNVFIWTVNSGNASVTDTVIITSNPAAAPAFAGEDQIVCGTEVTLSGSDPAQGAILWELVTGEGEISNPQEVSILVNNLQTGINQLTYTTTLGECTSTDTVNITSITQGVVSLSADTSVCPDYGSITITGTSSNPEGFWTVTQGSAIFSNETQATTNVSGIAPGSNVLVFTTGQSPCAASDSIQILLLADENALCGEIFIPEGFSPNGDLSNDLFVIYGVEGKQVNIKVFNRWGNLVYESDSYQNNWDGVCTTGGVLFGEQLPEATYYYLVQIEGENETRKGYLTLWR